MAKKTYSVRLDEWDMIAINKLKQELTIVYMQNGINLVPDRSQVISTAISMAARMIAKSEGKSFDEWLDIKK